jgi:N-acetylmuramoyl-L-alanine amidase
MKTIIIDPGHGGMWADIYATAGKRSPEIPPGFYEGVHMRKIAAELSTLALDRYDWISPILDCPGPDPALKSRIHVYNKIPCDLVLSLHSNAKGMGKKWFDAHGAIAFFDHGSKRRAVEKFMAHYCLASGMHNRGEKISTTLTMMRTKHREILLETGFHTNKKDVEKLKNISTIAHAIVSGLDAYFDEQR